MKNESDRVAPFPSFDFGVCTFFYLNKNLFLVPQSKIQIAKSYIIKK